MKLTAGRLGISTSPWALVSMLPVVAVIVHEFTHAVASLPFVERVDVRVGSSSADATFEWRRDAPLLAVRVAHLAPTLVGLGLALVLVALFGVPSPAWIAYAVARPLDALVALIVGLNWAVFTYPSPEDRRPFSS